jgi:hypothetical protein
VNFIGFRISPGKTEHHGNINPLLIHGLDYFLRTCELGLWRFVKKSERRLTDKKILPVQTNRPRKNMSMKINDHGSFNPLCKIERLTLN